MGSGKIAVVIPSIRPEMHADFVKGWQHLFEKHGVELVTVWDHKNQPYVDHRGFNYAEGRGFIWNLDQMNEGADLISNKCAAVRNMGFAYVAKFLPDVEYIITLDDDELPIGDTIQDHIDALNKKVPLSWFSTTLVDRPSDYMRGFPYGVRDEAEVVVSHGVWQTNPDYDAPTQLLNGSIVPEYYRGPIPYGVLFPFCGMNVAFKRKALPLMYYAPVSKYTGAERFDDIWAGIEIKKQLDELGLAVVSGYAVTDHTRASNVFKNLEHEAVGIRKNEEYWKGEMDDWYRDFINKRKQWYAYCSS